MKKVFILISVIIAIIIAIYLLKKSFILAFSNFRPMALNVRQEEAQTYLSFIRSVAQENYEIHRTYEIPDVTVFALPSKMNRYSFWYFVKGTPTVIPGSLQTNDPCDLMTPPTSVRTHASSTHFTITAKGNIDKDETCDEWSINQKGEINHTLNDRVN